MNTSPSTPEGRNQRISARIRRIQGQLSALERSIALEPEFSILLQRAAAARGAINGLMADLIGERLGSLKVVAANDEARAEVAEMIDFVHDYLS